MNTGNTMDVEIMGREFRVVCPVEEREELLQAVAYLNKRMREIRDSGIDKASDLPDFLV